MKWLPIVAAGIGGIALMVLLGFCFAPVISETTEGGELAIVLGIGAFCYFAAGLIAGAWANWRGWGHGAFAGILVWIGNLIHSFITGIAYGPLSQVPGFFLGVFIAGILGAAIGALGGFVGERIRR